MTQTTILLPPGTKPSQGSLLHMAYPRSNWSSVVFGWCQVPVMMNHIGLHNCAKAWFVTSLQLAPTKTNVAFCRLQISTAISIYMGESPNRYDNGQFSGNYVDQ